MYELFLRTANLLPLLYSLLFMKSTTYSLGFHFFSYSLVYELQIFLIMKSIVDIWENLGYGLRVKRKEKYLYIRKFNSTKNNSKKPNSSHS